MKNCIRPPYEKLKSLKSGFIENSNFENNRDPWQGWKMILTKYQKNLGARRLQFDIHTCEVKSLVSGWSSQQVYRPFRLWVGSEDLTRPERSICVTSPQHNPNLLRATITPSQALTISSMRCCVERQRFFPMWKAHLNSCTGKYIQSSKDYQEYTL